MSEEYFIIRKPEEIPKILERLQKKGFFSYRYWSVEFEISKRPLRTIEIVYVNGRLFILESENFICIRKIEITKSFLHEIRLFYAIFLGLKKISRKQKFVIVCNIT